MGDLQRFGLLASALSGRPLGVAPGEHGTRAWTDGRTVFLDADTGKRDQLEALAVQASLLAAGSLAHDVVRPLTRRAALARRYLAIEGHRALAANEHLLPPPLRSLIDRDVAARGDSPTASLAAAVSREAIPEPPDSFGTIRARHLLVSPDGATSSATTHQRALHLESNQLLAEPGDENDEGSTVVDLFSNPAGGGGALGRLFQRILTSVRQLTGGGPPAGHGQTHPTHVGRRSGTNAALFTGAAKALEAAAIDRRGTKYPEWDPHRRRYREDWCTVQEIEPRPADSTPPMESHGHDLRRPLARLGTGFDCLHRQVDGDDVDIDAAIEARVELVAGSAPDEAVYLDNRRRRRDLAVLLLLDVSGSAGEPGATGQTVHEHQRAAAAALTVALHHLGDRVALYGFRSQGRSAVHLLPVKRFDDTLDTLVTKRLHGLVPAAYSRLGAAIRHGTAVLENRGGTSRRLLVVVSDGLAYDHGYEPINGAADARRALAEARHQGIGCLCLSIGASTDGEALRRVFGTAAHAMIPGPEQLRRVIGPLFRSALRSAEGRRHAS